MSAKPPFPTRVKSIFGHQMITEAKHLAILHEIVAIQRSLEKVINSPCFVEERALPHRMASLFGPLRNHFDDRVIDFNYQMPNWNRMDFLFHKFNTSYDFLFKGT
ncbi:hypothetical protein TNIN_218161 [Trichonephila inaurata madagascariensis]|uniref:Uncharacterized protein n=1 Tax=Trichonephila inaurata madagascariensis TaxID=2747483 RepID=A0A8X6J962_9ARAC|nr:hypothetical protein TNIN_218161 [Trichonephila inaurata madagascariensis]